MDSISPGVYLIPPLMGVAAYLALHNLWIWRGRRGEPLHLWVSLWCANSLLYLASHYVQVASGLPEHAVLGGRLAWTSAIVLIVVTLGLAHALAGLPQPRRPMWSVGLVNGGLLVLLWATDLVVSSQAYVRTDVLGYRYGAPVPGPLVPLMAPYVLAVFAYAWRMLGRGQMDPGERRTIRAGLAVYIAFALNDMLHAARLIQSIRVFDLAFVAVGVGLTYMLVRRYNRLYTHLQDEVAGRTREIEARRAELSALVQSGQAVMGGLDLEATLQRIIDQARLITGSPHIKLLLVDREAGVLRMGALSGGTVPSDFQVPLGQSFSGTVAMTGQPLFVPDTRTDPRNLLAQRDREQGIVTYLGLPVRKGEEILGVLTINTESSHEYSAEELASLGSFADQAAIAIDNARLYSAAAEREKRLQALASLTAGLAATRPLDELLDDVVRSASELLAPAAARLWLTDEGGETISLRARAGDVSEVTGAVRLRLGEGMIGRIAASGEALAIEDLESYPGRINVERHRAEGLVSFAGVPLAIGERRLGALGIASRKRRRFGAEDMSLLRVLADHAAMAIDGARLLAAAQGQARELGALHEVRSALVSTLDPGSVLEAIGSSAMRLVHADGAAVFELDARAGLMLPRTTYGWRTDVGPLPVRLGQGAAGVAALRREPAWSEDIHSKPFPGYEEVAPGSDRPLGEAVQERPYRGILGVPLLSRDTVVGALCLYWIEPHAPDEREITLTMAVAQQAAVALENARLYRTAERRVERLETLTRLGRVLSSSLDRDQVLKAITESAAQLLQARGASFWLADEAARTLTLATFSPPALEADLPDRVRSFDEGLLGSIATHGREVNVPDVFTDARFLNPAWWRGHGLTSFFGAPVVHAGSLVGVLAVAGSRPIRLDAEDEAVLGAFMGQAAVAMQNASLYESARAQAREIEALHEIGTALVSSLDLTSVLDAITASAIALTRAGGSAVFELSPDDEILRLRACRGVDPERTPGTLGLGQGAAGAAAARREPVWSDDLLARPLPGHDAEAPGATRPLGEVARGLGYRALLAVPLLSRDTVLGAICLYWYEPHVPEAREIRLLGTFGRQAAVALENARLHHSLERRLRRVQMLTRIGRGLSGSLDLEAVLKEIAHAAAELMDVPVASFWLADNTSRTVRFAAFSETALEADWSARVLPFDQGVIGWVATHRRPLHVPDGVSTGRFVDADWWRAHGLRSFYGIPVMHQDSLLAVLALNGREPFRLDAEDEELLAAFASQAGVAIRNASLYATQAARLGRVEALARLTRVLSSSLDRDRILAEIARAAGELAAARFVTIWLADEATETLTLGGASDPGINAEWAPKTLPFGRSGVGWVAAHRRPLGVDDTFADERFVDPEWRRRNGLKSFLGLPVIHEGALVAVLSLSRLEPFSRDPEEGVLLSAFTAQAATAVHNASLYEAEAAARRAAELALAQVKQLHGMLPICAYCKKIRDDSNYWQSVESYIGQRSAATFSHGICPECKDKIVKPEMERWKRERGGQP